MQPRPPGRMTRVAVFALDQILRIGNTDEGGGVFGEGAPVGRAVRVPPLFDFGRVGGGDVGEGLGVQLEHVLVRIHFQHVFAEFLEAGDGFFGIGKMGEAAAPGVGRVDAVVDSGVGHVDGEKI